MKPEFRTGLTHTQRVVVDRDRTIGFMGEAMRVYSTPSMVSDIERTCKDFRRLSVAGSGKPSLKRRSGSIRTMPSR